MSPYHFSRMFKLSTGLSPHQYVIRQRIERAKALLTNTDLPVGVVAQEVGFASPSHFAQQFRRLVGVSPRSFRWDLSQQSKKPTKERKDSEAGRPAASDTDSSLSNKPTQGRQ